jgi:mannose/fructose/N-acetylgalactosamine-specific phosphotransferase system component IID
MTVSSSLSSTYELGDHFASYFDYEGGKFDTKPIHCCYARQSSSYTCMPIANYTVARSLGNQGTPTHHTIWLWRVDLCTSWFAYSGHLLDYSDGRYQAHPLLLCTSIVVYTCMPIVNYTVARSLGNQGTPTHHTIWLWRVDLCTSWFAYSGHLLDYSDGTKPIHCCYARQSSSTHVCQSQITQ